MFKGMQKRGEREKGGCKKVRKGNETVVKFMSHEDAFLNHE